MTAMEVMNLNQLVVMWTKSTSDRYGNITYTGQTELSTRFESKKEEALDEKGDTVAATVNIVVDQDIEDDALFWLAAAATLPGDLSTLTDLYTVNDFIKIPNVKGTRFRRRVILEKFSDTAPTFV